MCNICYLASIFSLRFDNHVPIVHGTLMCFTGGWHYRVKMMAAYHTNATPTSTSTTSKPYITHKYPYLNQRQGPIDEKLTRPAHLSRNKTMDGSNRRIVVRPRPPQPQSAHPASQDEVQEPQPERPIEIIERATQRKVTISRTLAPANLSRRCNPQRASPLYATLPKELRDLVFAFATAPTPDARRAYDPTDYWYRPGYTAPARTATTLLQTCRRVWLDAHAAPLRQAVHAFWFQRGPHDERPDRRWQLNIAAEHQRYRAWAAALTARGVRDVWHVQLFMQMHALELLADERWLQTFLSHALVRRGFAPRVWQVTIRHSDWAGWERGERLQLRDECVRYVLDAEELGVVERFQLELETLDSRRDQLDEIVQRLVSLEGKPKLVEPTNAECETAVRFVCKTTPTMDTWTGPTNINKEDREIFQGLDRLVYVTRTITWTNIRIPITEEGDEKHAKYCTLAPEPPPFAVRFPWLYHRHVLRPPTGIFEPRNRGSEVDLVSFERQQRHLWTNMVQQADEFINSMRTFYGKERLEENVCQDAVVIPGIAGATSKKHICCECVRMIREYSCLRHRGLVAGRLAVSRRTGSDENAA
nr:hypothetical protein CFP56_00502 [Quercus suber]